jgi:hypothetical protein
LNFAGKQRPSMCLSAGIGMCDQIKKSGRS